MGRFFSLFLGIIMSVIGGVLYIFCWKEVFIVLKGIIPFILLMIGVFSIIVGISEHRDIKRDKYKK